MILLKENVKKDRRAGWIIQSIEIWNQSVAAGMPVSRRFHGLFFLIHRIRVRRKRWVQTAEPILQVLQE
jgi:hypothetical protein